MVDLIPQRDDDDMDDGDRRGHKADGAYRTISEVADDLVVPQHVLRFWETKFKQISPLKRAGGRRFYRPQDIDLIKRVHYLLYTQGYTIKGVQKLLTKDRQLLQSVPQITPAEARVAVDHHVSDTAPINQQQVMDFTPDSTARYADMQHLLNRLKELRAHLVA